MLQKSAGLTVIPAMMPKVKCSRQVQQLNGGNDSQFFICVKIVFCGIVPVPGSICKNLNIAEIVICLDGPDR